MVRMTVPAFTAMKSAGEKITMLTAYDYTMARLLDGCGVDGLLVGDSLGMVVQGHENTLSVTLDEMIYHAEMVGRAAEHALVVVDMPFPTHLLGPYQAIENASHFLKRAACQAVKIEMGAEDAEVIGALTRAGIPVMAHCGLRPQNLHCMGGYKIQREEEQLHRDVKVAEAAGAFAVVLECVPRAIASEITSAVSIPTIGIGAGAGCDGQILVVNDLLGIPDTRLPKHVKAYAALGEQITSAVGSYCEEVRRGKFPTDEQTFE